MNFLFAVDPVLAFGFPGGIEVMVVGLVILLLFGNKLPSLMRNVGRSAVEFKKGVQGIEEDLEEAAKPSSSAASGPAEETAASPLQQRVDQDVADTGGNE